jgi:hypothetical protein
MIVDKLSEAILRSEFRKGDTAGADVEDEHIVLKVLKRTEEVALVGESKT